MTNRYMWLAIVLGVASVPKLTSAQQEAHQMPGMQAPSAELTQCLRVQPAIQNVITAAMARAEAARLSNSPTDLRAALDHLEAALRDVRAQSEPCATASASSDPHAGHTMPGMQAPTAPPAQAPSATPDPHAGHTMPSNQPTGAAPVQPPAAGAASPHAGHTMPGPSPAAKARPSTKPEAAKPAATKDADPHAGHAGHMGGQTGEKPSGDKQMDPVTGLMVDPATAPKTTYQGQMYYFSSEQSRKEFLENPAKFAKKSKG